jgi:hypothetical protein
MRALTISLFVLFCGSTALADPPTNTGQGLTTSNQADPGDTVRSGQFVFTDEGTIISSGTGTATAATTPGQN